MIGVSIEYRELRVTSTNLAGYDGDNNYLYECYRESRHFLFVVVVHWKKVENFTFEHVPLWVICRTFVNML